MLISEFTNFQCIHCRVAEETECCFYFSFAADPGTIFRNYGAGTPRKGGMTDRNLKIMAGLRQMKTIMPAAI